MNIATFYKKNKSITAKLEWYKKVFELFRKNDRFVCILSYKNRNYLKLKKLAKIRYFTIAM